MVHRRRWHYENPAALALMRAWNAPASLALYGVCSLLWLYRGSLRDLATDIAGARRGGWGG